MYQNIFKREEQKYLLNKKQYSHLMKELKPYLEKDRFFNNTICNMFNCNGKCTDNAHRTRT